MVERYIEVTDEYVKQLEQGIDNLKKINEKHKKLNGELREENKKQKEIIDRAIKIIEDTYYSKNTTDIDSIVSSSDKLIKVRKILKEVE